MGLYLLLKLFPMTNCHWLKQLDLKSGWEYNTQCRETHDRPHIIGQWQWLVIVLGSMHIHIRKLQNENTVDRIDLQQAVVITEHKDWLHYRQRYCFPYANISDYLIHQHPKHLHQILMPDRTETFQSLPNRLWSYFQNILPAVQVQVI